MEDQLEMNLLKSWRKAWGSNMANYGTNCFRLLVIDSGACGSSWIGGRKVVSMMIVIIVPTIVVSIVAGVIACIVSGVVAVTVVG